MSTPRWDVPQRESVNTDIDVHPFIHPDDENFPTRRLPIVNHLEEGIGDGYTKW